MIDWDRFRCLPGCPRENFEKLWRNLAFRSYGDCGVFREHKNMPGVEFVLELTRNCIELGKKGDWIGWQCKFLDETEGDGSPKSSIRGQVRKSLKKVSGLTKCYVCTNASKLLKDDQNWIQAESKNLKIPLQWAVDEHLENCLKQIPEGDLLRAAYFGECSLSETDLAAAFERSIAPVRHRYNPDVYTESPAERMLRMHLLEQNNWNLERPVDEQCWLGGDDQVLQRMERAIGWLQDRISHSGKSVQLSGNGFWGRCRSGVELLRSSRKKLLEEMRRPLVGIMADAGCGKTCLGISLAKPVSGVRPAGAFFLARNLGATGIDGVAGSFLFRSRPAKTMQEVLTALEVAGRNCRVKMPLVIDGLNECERPGRWKDILAQMCDDVRKRYPHVLIVVTYRSGQPASLRLGQKDEKIPESTRNVYYDLCIPERAKEQGSFFWELYRGNGEVMWNRYKDYYKIECEDRLPYVLHHPLAMYLYCESVNKSRQETVRVRELPKDLSSVFDAFCTEVSKNVCSSRFVADAPRREDVREGLRQFGRLMLKSRQRWVSVDEVRKSMPLLAGKTVDWVTILREEGVCLDGLNGKDSVLEIAYDALGGYLVAEGILHDGDESPPINGHVLSEDLVSSLVHLYAARTHGGYVRTKISNIDSDVCALAAVHLPDEWLAPEVIDGIVAASRRKDAVLREVLQRVLAEPHEGRLNATYLDVLLTDLNCGQRDRVWGLLVVREWERFDELLWQIAPGHWQTDLVLCKWLLTSPCKTIRNRATHVLQDIGVAHPAEMFDAVVKSLGVNDLYLVERMASVGYAVAMVLQIKRNPPDWREQIIRFAECIIAASLCRGATCPMSHRAALDALVNAIALARHIGGESMPKRLARFQIPFRVRYSPFRCTWRLRKRDIALVDRALHMDFENYSLTRLVGEWSYQTGSKKYKVTRAKIEQRMYDMGYRWTDFNEFDDLVRDRPWKPNGSDAAFCFERFGKKYQLMAYEEMIPWVRHDHDSHSWPVSTRWDAREVRDFGRECDENRNPCFWPEAVPYPHALPEGIVDAKRDLLAWLKNGEVPHFAEALSGNLFDDGEKWVLLHGYVAQDRWDTHRFYTCIDGVFVSPGKADKLSEQCETQLIHFDCREFPDVYYWEFPWSRQCEWNPDSGERGEVVRCPWTERDVEIPYCSVSAGEGCQDSKEDVSRYAMLPYPFVAQALRLHSSAEDLDWYDERGRKAVRFYSKSKSVGGQDHDSHRLLFMRQDLVVEYARLRGMRFIQCCVGEREAAPAITEKDFDFYQTKAPPYTEREFSYANVPISAEVRKFDFESRAQDVLKMCPHVMMVVGASWSGGDFFERDTELRILDQGRYSDAGVLFKRPRRFAFCSRNPIQGHPADAVADYYLLNRESVFVLNGDSDVGKGAWWHPVVVALLRSAKKPRLILWYLRYLTTGVWRSCRRRYQNWKDAHKKPFVPKIDFETLSRVCGEAPIDTTVSREIAGTGPAKRHAH